MKIITEETKSSTFLNALFQDKISARDRLLAKMGVRDNNPPLMIENAIERVINPFFVARYHSQLGFPKELTLEEIGRKLNIKWQDYWSEWCNFWFDSFTKIPHNILLNSKLYYDKIK